MSNSSGAGGPRAASAPRGIPMGEMRTIHATATLPRGAARVAPLDPISDRQGPNVSGALSGLLWRESHALEPPNGRRGASRGRTGKAQFSTHRDALLLHGLRLRITESKASNTPSSLSMGNPRTNSYKRTETLAQQVRVPLLNRRHERECARPAPRADTARQCPSLDIGNY